MSAAMIAETFSRSEATIYKWLREAGGTARSRGDARNVALARSR